MLAVSLQLLGTSSDNGLALVPPMGWRSWNCFHGNVNQSILEGQVDGLAARNASRGDGRSLLQHGYSSIGLDDNWQACGAGINGSFHDAAGHPLVNTAAFPSMKGLCDYGHAKVRSLPCAHTCARARASTHTRTRARARASPILRPHRCPRLSAATPPPRAPYTGRQDGLV